MGNDQFEPAGERDKERPAHHSAIDKPASDLTGNPAETRDETRDEAHDELERQARETMRVFRESAGELGTRVRQVMSRASELWAQATPAAEVGGRDPSMAVAAEELRARALARRWVALDFLVDPELPDAMGATAIHDMAVWRVDLIERGESRHLADAAEPYQGAAPAAPGPILPVWDYSFPAVPEIEAGERRERLPATDLLIACDKCGGSGHRACVACEGKGFLPCPKCHGRSRVPCRRCRGRGVVADAAAERRARSDKSYWQVHAERMANDAAGRLADFSERLRQEHGVPLPPSAQWAPVAPASGVTVPCPDCRDGTIPCECRDGKLICEVCKGSALAECAACGATGRVIRHRELVRRFDTRMTERVIPPDDPEAAEWLSRHSLRRVGGEAFWEGSAESIATEQPPEGVSATVWSVARELASGPSHTPVNYEETARGERRVLSRHIRLLRVPFTRVEYTFAGQPFEFVAVGTRGGERFFAQSFPARWTRVSRFLRAVMRDLAAERPERPAPPNGEISTLSEYRSRRLRQQPYHVRILADVEEAGKAATDATPPSDAEPRGQTQPDQAQPDQAQPSASHPAQTGEVG